MNEKYQAHCSFGKDSTTMCDLLLRDGIRVDEIIFTDTLLEFPEMYIYANKIKEYFELRYKVKFTILMPSTTFEEWCFGVIRKKSAKQYGKIRGIPNPADNDTQCYWRRESKVKPEEEYNKKFNGKIIKYFGYTLGENRSVEGGLTPLRSDFEVDGVVYKSYKMKEIDCKFYLEHREMENPLYKLFTRTGCGICPFQSERSWFQIWDKYKYLWEYIKWVEKRLEYYENSGMKVANRFWFTKHRTTEQMEFIFKNSNNKLMDFSDEPVKDCLCKI